MCFYLIFIETKILATYLLLLTKISKKIIIVNIIFVFNLDFIVFNIC